MQTCGEKISYPLRFMKGTLVEKNNRLQNYSSNFYINITYVCGRYSILKVFLLKAKKVVIYRIKDSIPRILNEKL